MLGSNDLATFGASGLDRARRDPARRRAGQFACNVAGLWLHNFASGLSRGRQQRRLAAVRADHRSRRDAPGGHPSPDLHDNYYPIENSSQCQAGNEGYTGKQPIGNPPKTSTVVDQTDAARRAYFSVGRKAGLVP